MRNNNHLATTVLTRVESASHAKRAWRVMHRSIAAGSSRTTRTLGFRNGSSDPLRLHVREDLGIWMAPGRVISRGYWWCPFGTLPMSPAGNLSMVVQINRVVNPESRPTAACIAVDGEGSEWICHTGRVGGGKPGIGKSAFVAWTDREPARVVAGDGNVLTAFPIARLDSESVAMDVAEFVHEVARFKADTSSPREPRRPGPFGGADDEREGISEVAPRSGYEMRRTHALVRNRLRDLVAEVRPDTSRDAQRDLIVGTRQRPDIEFEVKPCSDWQSIYTAVGQLLLHSTVFPARRRVAVLPEGVDDRRARAVRSLGVDLVTFKMTKSRVHFKGLSKVIPNAPSSAPLRPAKR